MNLSELVYESGKLSKIAAFTNGGGICGLLFSFEGMAFYSTVSSDTDEIAIQEFVPSSHKETKYPNRLNACIGKKLIWAWTLENQQGYSNGLRLEFEDSLVFDFIAVASDLKIFDAQEI